MTLLPQCPGILPRNERPYGPIHILCTALGATRYIKLLDRIQRRTTKMMEPYKEQMRFPDLFCLKKKQKEDLITIYSFLMKWRS